MTVRGENGDFRDAQTRIHKSGGREPAVVSETVFATGIVYRGVIAFLAHDQRPHHGWLTPPAPGCVCGCYCRYAFP
jgi:hypothetical protein